MARDLFYASKKFLNKDGHHSDATIFTEIEFVDTEGPWTDCSLKIRDCVQHINLAIDIDYDDGTPKFDNTLFKLDTLIEEIQRFREACVKAAEESKRRAAVRELKGKQEKEEREKNRKYEMDTRDSSVTPEHNISGSASATHSRLGSLQERINNPRNI